MMNDMEPNINKYYLLFKGVPMKNKELAKQAVFFEAAKKLYEAGALDDNLLAVRPAFPNKIDAFFKGLTSKAIPGEEEEGEIVESSDKGVPKVTEVGDGDGGMESRPPTEWYKRQVRVGVLSIECILN
jgi:hypothetical protein